jgi:hypothetical protein
MQIKNIEDLRNDLLSKYEDSKTDADIRDLSVYTATASAVIRSCKTEMDYNKIQENNKTIKFLEND